MYSILKQERERKSLTIEAVAQELKIRRKYLVAIEEGNLSELPGGTYTTGYIRLYANYLGVKIDDIKAPAPEDAFEDLIIEEKEEKQIELQRQGALKKKLAYGCVLVTIILLVTYTLLWRKKIRGSAHLNVKPIAEVTATSTLDIESEDGGFDILELPDGEERDEE